MNALEIVAALCAAVAALAWIVCIVAGLGMLRHRAPGLSRFWYMTHGMAFYTGRPFGPGAAPYYRRFRLAAAVFFGAILLAAVAGLVFGDFEKGGNQ